MTQDLQQSLRSSDARVRLGAVKEIKNQVIGNRFKKLQYLHLLPQLLELAITDETLQIQCLAAVGSLAYGVEEGVKAIVACNGINSIMQALQSNDSKVVEAAARSLKLVYQSPLAPHEPLLLTPALPQLVLLIQDSPHLAAVAQAAASIISHCCTTPAEAQLVVDAGAVPALLRLLHSPLEASQEAAVEALAAVTHHSPDACQQLLQSRSQAQLRQPQGQLLDELLKDSSVLLKLTLVARPVP
eukprot:gene6831-7049_t